MRPTIERAPTLKDRLASSMAPALGAICVLAGAASAWGVGRSGATHDVTIDALTAGGRQGASVSYIRADSAVGQAVPRNVSENAGYRNETGVIYAWGAMGPPQIPPDRPTNVLPTDGATSLALTPTLQSSLARSGSSGG